MKKLKNESGMLIVEATIVFPIMFLIIFLMIFMGNAYFQRSRVESVATEMAYYGAAQCADPLLKVVQTTGGIPDYGEANYEIQPYRYILGEVGSSAGMSKIETDVKNQVKNKINNLGTGLFSLMKPTASKIESEFHNVYVYSSFEVQIDYKIPLPIRLIGMNNNFSMKASSICKVPVSDTPEFIRNVDMVEDWVQTTEGGQKAIDKTHEIMGKIEQFIN